MLRWLLVTPISVELSVLELPSVHGAIREDLLAFTVGEVLAERSCVLAAVGIGQNALTFFDAVTPGTFIHSSVLPPACALAVHLVVLPVAGVAPATFLADKNTVT